MLLSGLVRYPLRSQPLVVLTGKHSSLFLGFLSTPSWLPIRVKLVTWWSLLMVTSSITTLPTTAFTHSSEPSSTDKGRGARQRSQCKRSSSASSHSKEMPISNGRATADNHVLWFQPKQRSKREQLFLLFST